MNVREYLQQIRMLDVEISQRMMEKNDLNYIASRHPGTRNHCEELAAGIDEKISSLVNRKDHIIGQILMLKDQRLSEILFLHYARYIQLEKIEGILLKRNGKIYSYAHIKALHNEALNEFQNLLQ